MDHVIGYDLARGLHIIAVIAWIGSVGGYKAGDSHGGLTHFQATM